MGKGLTGERGLETAGEREGGWLVGWLVCEQASGGMYRAGKER